MVTHLAQGDVIGGREGWGVGQGQCWEGGQWSKVHWRVDSLKVVSYSRVGSLEALIFLFCTVASKSCILVMQEIVAAIQMPVQKKNK